jgi:hypothetical protein
MAWAEDEAIGPDVASAGLHISERIGRDAAAQPDLEEALEASRYASHPYSSHPKEVIPAAQLYSRGCARLRRSAAAAYVLSQVVCSAVSEDCPAEY